MILTEANYYSDEANWAYFSASQFKAFERCPACAMAELRGEWQRPESEALLLGQYVDERLTGTKESFQAFVEANYTKIFTRTEGKRAAFRNADEAVRRVMEQPLMCKQLGGQHQVIMTGEIEGVPFKIKMDSYHPGEMIVDLKYMRSLRSPNAYQPMVQYWGYDLQGAIYQEIVRQNTGEILPFYLNVVTKETPPRAAVGRIAQLHLNAALDRVKSRIVGYQTIKAGQAPATRCEAYDCDFCAGTQVITSPVDTDYFGYSAAQLAEAELYRGGEI